MRSLPVWFSRRAGGPLRRLAWMMVAGLALARPVAAQMQHEADDGSPQFRLHGFSHVNFWGRWPGRGPSQNGAALGNVDLFMTSRLADRVSFLTEANFEVADNGSTGVDLERLLLKYSLSDWFKLSVGRGHTALGYWNEEVHHGALLQPTVERPRALQFEDEKGILPVHFVGIEASGTVRVSSEWNLHYTGNVANGRGAVVDQVQGGRDLDRHKAVALKLSLQRNGDISIRVGPSLYLDRIPGDSMSSGPLRETILGAHVVVKHTRYTFQAEGYRIRHQQIQGGTTWHHWAGYAIATVRFKRITPYAGLDHESFDPGDPFFVGRDQDYTRVLGGLRFDVNVNNSLKLEYQHDHFPAETGDALALQIAFTF